MHETGFSFSHIEHPPARTGLPPGRHILGGWVMPKAGGHFADVRARLGGRIFPGILGWPRADLAAHFRTGRPVALAEFRIVVDLPPGPSDIVLEVLEIEGRWSPFQQVAFATLPGLPRAEVWTPPSPLRWHDYCRGLDRVLRARRSLPQAAWAGLAEQAADNLPWPRDLCTPEDPFVGFIDEPAIINRCRFGRIPVLGWVFHKHAEIHRLWATSDLQVLQPVAYGREMPLVEAHYPAHAAAARRSGYFGLIDVPAQLPNPVSIRVYAETADGRLHLIHGLRTRLHAVDEEKLPYTPHPPAAFDEARAAWQAALDARGIPVLEDADFQPGLAKLRAAYAENTAPVAMPPPRVRTVPPAPTSFPQRILLVTHNLNREGAPLFLLDLAARYAAAGARLTVLSPEQGALRGSFESLGAQVAVVSTAPVFSAASPEAVAAAIRDLVGAFDFAPYDLVVCSTFTTFWAVHAAKAAGRKVLLYVHESTTPAAFYEDRVPPAVVDAAGAAFDLADGISFTTHATRRYHLGHRRLDHHFVTPGWIDVARIDAWRAAHPRDSLRARFNLRPGELLVTNVGTVSDRKGQHTFARAVDLLWRRHPELAARTRFILLGGRQSPFDDMLRDLLAALGRPNLAVHPETSDYLPYYGAADLTVCSSYEESSPRVVLEAMACGAPLLATDVHGIPELVRPGLEATLAPAGDTVAWCEALARLLLSPAIGLDLAARARARVVVEFDSAVLLPRHLAVAAAVAGR